jgi:ankyrin repeat protein
MFAAARGRDDVIRLLMKHGADPGIITSIHEIGRVRIDPEGHFVAETPADIQAAKDLAKRNHPQGAAQIQATLDQSKLDLDRLGRALGLKSVEFRAGKAFTHPPPALNFDYIGPHFVGGMTALIYAAREGHLNAVAALLEGGADIDQVNSEKYTPLVIAITNGHLDLAGYLLNHGADPNLSTMTGLSPLYAVVDVQWAPHASYPQPNTEQEKTGYLDLMRALLDHGANPDAQVSDSLWFRSFISDRTWADPTGSTPFWRAAQASDIRAMRLLVDHGANPKTPTKAKVTPLMVAAGVGWAANWSVNAPDPAIEAVQYCVERGNDVNAADENHNTALHGAAFIGNNEIVKYLVDHGAKVDVKNGDGDSPADMANGPNRFAPPHPETVAMLEKLGSPNSHNCRSAQCIVDVKPKSEPGLSSAEQSNKDALEALAATLGLHSVIYRAGPSEPKAVSSSGH